MHLLAYHSVRWKSKEAATSVALPASNYPAAANFLPPAETEICHHFNWYKYIFICQSQKLGKIVFCGSARLEKSACMRYEVN